MKFWCHYMRFRSMFKNLFTQSWKMKWNRDLSLYNEKNTFSVWRFTHVVLIAARCFNVSCLLCVEYLILNSLHKKIHTHVKHANKMSKCVYIYLFVHMSSITNNMWKLANIDDYDKLSRWQQEHTVTKYTKSMRNHLSKSTKN